MPRQSYREHRAARARAAAAYGSDAELESLASFSTLASHTTLASVRPSYSSYAAHTYTPLDSLSSSFSAAGGALMEGAGAGAGSSSSNNNTLSDFGPPPIQLSPPWNPAAAAGHRGHRGQTPSISISATGTMSRDSSPAPSVPRSYTGSGSRMPSVGASSPTPPSPTASSSLPSPRPITARTSSTSSAGIIHQGPPSPVAPDRSGQHLVPSAVSRLKKESSSSSGKDREREREREREKSRSKSREEDAKRRKKERNAERWRRVRAREAAHDAPVRRWAKAAYARFGAKGAMASAVVFALALRILLTLVALYISPRVRNTLTKQVVGARAACSHPPLKTFAPLCGAMLGAPGTPIAPSAPVALIAGHLALEAVLGWGAAIAWAVIEGWREGRTVRTRVAAVVYVVLAPVLTLSDGALLQMRTAPIGLMAWAILAACSGHDGAAAATIAAAWWSERGMGVYIPAFAVYAVGKRIWLGPKGRGYLARLAVSASMVLTVLGSLQPVPLRARIMDAIANAKSCLTPAAALTCMKSALSLITLRSVITLLALVPSAYLMIRASYILRPAPTENYTSQSVPATVRLLPLMFVAVAAALCLPSGDAALPLLPLSLASSLRGDDDEWAVAVQTHHVAAMCLWPAFGRLIPLASATTLGWDWLIGARTDAPNRFLRAHQITTKIIAKAALVPWTIVARQLAARVPSVVASVDKLHLIRHLVTAHRVFTLASIGMLVVWTNIRLIKAAWAIGAL